MLLYTGCSILQATEKNELQVSARNKHVHNNLQNFSPNLELATLTAPLLGSRVIHM